MMCRCDVKGEKMERGERMEGEDRNMGGQNGVYGVQGKKLCWRLQRTIEGCSTG
jgi:hypothetical protein